MLSCNLPLPGFTSDDILDNDKTFWTQYCEARGKMPTSSLDNPSDQHVAVILPSGAYVSCTIHSDNVTYVFVMLVLIQ